MENAPRYTARVLDVMASQLPVVSSTDDVDELAYRSSVTRNQCRRALRFLAENGALELTVDRGERTYVLPDGNR